jgi:hypothetical protein
MRVVVAVMMMMMMTRRWRWRWKNNNIYIDMIFPALKKRKHMGLNQIELLQVDTVVL